MKEKQMNKFCSVRLAVSILGTAVAAFTLILLFLLAFAAYVPSPGLAQPTSDANYILSDLSWEKEPWTGSDAPFISAKADIDREFTGSYLPSLIVDKYAKIAAANPTSALDQFRWAYAEFDFLLLPHNRTNDDETIIVPVVVGMAKAKPPHSYQYTRLRFLLQGPDGTLSFVKRLVDKDPNDWLVKEQYACMLCINYSPANAALAISTQEAVVAHHADWPHCNGTLAFVYSEVGGLGHNISYYKKALAAEDTCIRLTNPADSQLAFWKQIRKQLESCIKNNSLYYDGP